MASPSSSVTTQSSRSSKYHEGGANTNDQNDGTNENNPHLSRLLKQLRPFQHEAYDYVTKGIVNNRQFNVPKNLDAKKSKKKDKYSKPTKNNTSTVTENKNEEKFVNLNGRLLLADEMGLGKSITSLAIMSHYMSEWPLLILCPASLRSIWPNEIEKFLPGLPPSSVYVVQGFDDADFYENEQKRKKIKIVVATYSLLQKRSASARCLQDFKFQCVIADESHNLKQKDSQRTQLAMPLLQGAKRLALLSGTVCKQTC
jgi:SNF2 family DNA or RNA helicase